MHHSTQQHTMRVAVHLKKYSKSYFFNALQPIKYRDVQCKVPLNQKSAPQDLYEKMKNNFVRNFIPLYNCITPYTYNPQIESI